MVRRFHKTVARYAATWQTVIAYLSLPAFRPIMDAILFRAFQRAYDQLSADNEAVIDWADDTEFRLSVSRRDFKAAVKLARQGVLDKIAVIKAGDRA